MKGQKYYGHAVLLTGYKGDKITFLNSWGDEWWDEGYFTVEEDAIPCEYFEINETP